MTPRLLAISVLVMTATWSGSAAEDDRRVARRSGIAIGEHLRAGDRSVTIVDDTPPPLFVNPPDGTSFAEWLIELRATVFTGRVRQLRSVPTSSSDFIETTVVFDVDEVLFEPDRGRDVRSTEWFTLPGGNMTVNGVHVRAEVSWAQAPRPACRYLVYASRGEKGELLVGPWSMFELDGEGAAHRLADVPFTAGFGDLPELAVLNDIRAAASRSR